MTPPLKSVPLHAAGSVSDVPDGSLNTDLLKLLSEISEQLVRLDERMKHLTENVTSANSNVTKLEERVSALEKKVYAAAGIAALVGAFVPDSVMRALGA